MTDEKDEEKTPFGSWMFDEHGLPAFKYTCKEFSSENAWYYTTFGGSRTHYHFFGNECWTSFANNHGQIMVLDGRRGFTLIGASSSGVTGRGVGLGACLLRFGDENFILDINREKKEVLKERRLGSWYFKKEVSFNDVKLTNILMNPQGDDPVLICEIDIENISSNFQSLDLHSFWDLYHLPISRSLIVTMNGRKDFSFNKVLNLLMRFLSRIQRILRMDTDGSRKRHARRIKMSLEEKTASKIILQPYHQGKGNGMMFKPSIINYKPYPVFVSVLNLEANEVTCSKTEIARVLDVELLDALDISNQRGNSKKRLKDSFYKSIRNDDACAMFHFKLNLKARSKKKIYLLFGSAKRNHIQSLIGKYRSLLEGSTSIQKIAMEWKDKLLYFQVPTMPWLERETAWHSACLLGSLMKDDYQGYHRIPQGSIYLMGHGLDGSFRDYCLFLYPLIFIDPFKAKEFLKYILSHVEMDGRLVYALHGFGERLEIPLVHSNPSDLNFFLAWILQEYLSLTRDFRFLDEYLSFRDKNGNLQEEKVFNIVYRFLRYAMGKKIGLGPSGLIRVRDGDWNDGITFIVKNRSKFKRIGESLLNSAILAKAFPRLAEILKSHDKKLASEMVELSENVTAAIDKSWMGHWFARGYEGKNAPIEPSRLFLDHHVWILVNDTISSEKIEEVLKQIEVRLIKPSKYGANILSPVFDNIKTYFPPGWDVNGGTWHAINSLLAWGVRVRHPENSLDFIEKMSMHRRSTRYARIWYGQWSGPDSYNSDASPYHPGEAFYHVATPMCDFPFWNINLHAGFLSAVIHHVRVLGNRDKLRLDLSTRDCFKFKSNLISVLKEPSAIEVTFSFRFRDDFKIEVNLPVDFMTGVNVINEDGKEILHEKAGNSIVVDYFQRDPLRMLRILRIPER
ncbi:MAG: GH36-type glycosyl hydrolase domain-containing protein [Promethearchaeota archaeon]